MKLQKKNEDKRIITLGIVLAIMVIGIGIAAYFGINFYLDKAEEEQSKEETAKLSEEMLEQINKTTITEEPTYTVTVMPSTEISATPATTLMPENTIAPEITQEPTEIPLVATVSTKTAADTDGLTAATIDYSKASTTRFQFFTDRSVSLIYDGKENTCWQEGSSGNGEGAVIYMTLKNSMEVSKITFKLGNWESESEYKLNSVPKEMTIWLDGQSFDVTFPHSMMEQCVTFSKPVEATEIYLRIDSVYEGTYENTGISEMEIYGY